MPRRRRLLLQLTDTQLHRIFKFYEISCFLLKKTFVPKLVKKGVNNEKYNKNKNNKSVLESILNLDQQKNYACFKVR